MPRSLHLLFIGDSLIEFHDWHREFKDHTITNLGRAGETVEGLLGRMEATWARIKSPDMIILMTGTNNIGMEDYAFGPAYEKILHILSRNFAYADIIATSLLPLRLPWLDGSAVTRMNAQLKELIIRRGATYLDLFHLFTADQPDGGDRCFSRYYLEDCVHLSAQGYQVWAQALTPLIETAASSRKQS